MPVLVLDGLLSLSFMKRRAGQRTRHFYSLSFSLLLSSSFLFLLPCGVGPGTSTQCQARAVIVYRWLKLLPGGSSVCSIIRWLSIERSLGAKTFLRCWGLAHMTFWWK